MYDEAAVNVTMPKTVGRYQILDRLAVGGMAELYKATLQADHGFEKLVVIKKILPHLAVDRSFVEMFIDEARITAQLDHRHIVQVFELGTDADTPYIAMQYVDGLDVLGLLRECARAQIRLPPDLAAMIARDVLDALDYAHNAVDSSGKALGIIHRDISPGNVLLSWRGDVKLTDFGIAKARTRTRQSAIGTVAGKPSYMSPEQASGETVDARSDLFSVGTLLYYLLTAELPFRAPNDRELMMRVASGEFASPAKVNPGLPKEVVKLVLKAMQRSPDSRFQSAQEMLTALEKVQREELAPFGRSELEAWLHALTAKDGRVPITRESMLPQPSAPKEEWIELSSDELKALTPEKRSRSGLTLAVIGLIIAAGAGAELVRQRLVRNPARTASLAPAHAVEIVDAGAAATVVAVVVADASVEEIVDAGAEAALSEAPDAQAIEAVAEVPPPPEAPAAPAPEPVAAPPAAVVAPPSPEAPVALKVFARLGPPPKGDPLPKDRAMVQLDSDPEGAEVKVDHHTLGTTPVALRFKVGIIFELSFEHLGYPANVQWMTLTERPDRPPRVSLHPPSPK
jgi:serine/threonine-protein kinase